MSCYMRHLTGMLVEAGIEVTPQNRKQVDEAIHEAVGITYKDCPTTWRTLKENVLGDDEKRRDFFIKIKAAL